MQVREWLYKTAVASPAGMYTLCETDLRRAYCHESAAIRALGLWLGAVPFWGKTNCALAYLLFYVAHSPISFIGSGDCVTRS